MTKVKDLPGASEAIGAVANGLNETRLVMDAEAFIEDGIRPDELPSNRRYRWPYPDELPDDYPGYRETLERVLEQYYERHGHPTD